MKNYSALFFVLIITTASFPVCALEPLAWKYEYDDLDRVISKIDPAGRITRFQYSESMEGILNEITKTSPDGNSVVWQYNDKNQLKKMIDESGIVEYGYDELGRINHVQRMGQPVISYVYDTLDRITGLKIGESFGLTYKYDFLGRLSKIKTSAGEISYDYQTGRGVVTRTLPNGIRTNWMGSPDGKLTEISHVQKNNNIIAQFKYVYRADGLISGMSHWDSRWGNKVTEFEYDNVQRLTKVNDSSGKKTEYQYDQLGNRTALFVNGEKKNDSKYNWAGQMESLIGQAWAHDMAGNFTSFTGNKGQYNIEYNTTGSVKSIKLNGSSVNYKYDGEGYLITRTAGTKKTQYIPDPLTDNFSPLLAIDSDGNKTFYIWDGQSPLMAISDKEVKFFLNDYLGSVRCVVNKDGEIIKKYDFSPFGVPENNITGTDLIPGYAGLFFDGSISMYLTHARIYDPQTGQFLQTEPRHLIPDGSQKDLSLYAYCGGDPVNFVDRNGAEPRPLMLTDGMGNSVSELSYPMIAIPRKQRWPQYPGQTPPDDYLQVIDGGMSRDWLVRTLEQYEKDVMNKNPNFNDRTSIRREAVNQFSKDYSRYDPHIPKDTKLYTTHIANMNIATDIGLVNVDWLTTVISTGFTHGPIEAVTSRLSPRPRYYVGKFINNYIAKPWGKLTNNGKGPITDWNNPYPKSNLNAVKIIEERIFNPDIPFSQVFQPPQYKHISSSKSYEMTKPVMNLDPGQPKPPYRRRNEYWSDIKYGLWGGDDGGPGGGGISALTPSNVGGVYLGGAGKALDNIGLISGISVDRNNNLVLLSNDDATIKLPPLRIDDAVTIFRSVYLYGEGPTVTIDPASENPEESAMVIRHGKATEDTYVGWILYEADRLMKGYTLGVDNKTQKDVTSRVAGYDEVLKTIYFGKANQGVKQKDGHWQRFWIVPSEAKRYESPGNKLTLMDVPLKVKTQSMKWKNGQLEDDPDGKSSPGAMAFTDWFTGNYDLIGQEQYLTPPSASGIKNPVPVFSELRRIALITAIAEKLRDQGTPLPFWMLDYDVKPVPFEKITRALRVTRSNDKVESRIFGGVQLSPDDKDVKVYDKNSDLKKLTKDEQAQVQKQIAVAAGLVKPLESFSQRAEPLKPENISLNGNIYQAVSMPGTDTVALGPLQLEEEDISVPLPDGRTISLIRKYNSFFNPEGPWGKGWALDLPRLIEMKVPVDRGNSSVQYSTAYEVRTPLNSTYARFSRIEQIPRFNNVKLLVPDKKCEFIAMADAKLDFLTQPTDALYLNDGSEYHFIETGELAAVVDKGLTTVYERNNKGNVTRIIGLLGKKTVGEIMVNFNKDGSLASAVGKNAQGEVNVYYEYDSAGRLDGVKTAKGRVGYNYKGPHLAVITWKDSKAKKEETIRSFEYNNVGQLVTDTYGDKDSIKYNIVKTTDGTVATASLVPDKDKKEVIKYDNTFRPTEATYVDGTQIKWEYPKHGGMEITYSSDGQPGVKVIKSSDKRNVKLKTTDWPELSAEKDKAGNLVSLSENGKTLIKQHWNNNGTLKRIENETTALWPQYDQDGIVNSILLTTPGDKEQLSEFQEIKVDIQGRPVEIKDNRGLDRIIQYDESGQIASVIEKRDNKNYGYKIEREKDGRIKSLNSSWGSEEYIYDNDNTLKIVNFERQGQTASINYDAGLIRKVKQFDGGVTTLSYYQEGQNKGLLKNISCPNKVNLEYHYDESEQISKIDVGNTNQVVLDFDDKGRVSGYRWQKAKNLQ